MSQNKSYPNQKTIFVLPKEVHKQKYTLIKNDILFFVSKDLNKIALFLWFYFYCFLNVSMELHQKQICEELGISVQSYYNGLSELNKKNYLITDGERCLRFFALPYDFPAERNENDKELGIAEYSRKQNKIIEGKLYKRVVGETGKENVYTYFLNSLLIDKMKNLSYGGFIVWIYLSTLVPGSFYLSQTSVSSLMGLGRRQYLEGVKELIEKGILIEQNNNNYNFNPNIYLKEDLKKTQTRENFFNIQNYEETNQPSPFMRRQVQHRE